MPSNAPTTRDETGSALLLALVFVIAVGLLVLGLLDLSGDDLLNTSNLQSQRALEYAADGAVDAAVQAVRYSDDFNSGSTPANCLPGVSSMALTATGPRIAVYCVNDGSSSAAPPTPPATTPPGSAYRGVDVYACSSASAPCSAANAIVTAQVTFDDYSNSDAYECSPSTGTTTCGTGMIVDSWVVDTANH